MITEIEKTIDDVKALMQKATPLVSKQELELAFDKIAAQITEKMADQNPIVLAVMSGGLYCTSEIIMRLDFPLYLDYVHASRYEGEISGGKLGWRVEPKVDLTDRVVLIIDDILDLGLTLSGVVDYCNEKGAKKVFTAVMTDKQVKRAKGGVHKADFTGLEVENKFLIGSGLDYKGYLRNLPGIWSVEE